jgi:predicted TIM-barrel fold metal-dependent hydrolase
MGGVWASLNFPSALSGFCGAVYAKSKDPELGLAVTKAWNDWVHEEWWGPYPDRIIPMALTWLADPKLGAEEIRRNAARGFVAVSLPEMPHKLGLPSVFTGWWDPIFVACEETDTAICLHVSSSGGLPDAPDAPPLLTGETRFPVLSLLAAIDWVWSGIVVRYPRLKIVMSEGGIGWVPMLIDRLNYVTEHSGVVRAGQHWKGDLTPAETFLRNFYFCTIDDPSVLSCRDTMGVDHIMVEVDYPHSDSTWPNTRQLLKERFKDIPDDEVRLMTHQNAARIFRHPLPRSS